MRAVWAKTLGSVLLLLAFSNVLFAALNQIPLVAALGPALFVAAFGAVAWWWGLRTSESRSREGPNTIWIAAAKIVGSVSIIYGLGTELLFTVVGRSDLATGTLTLFSGIGAALWLWALYADRTRTTRTPSAVAGDLPLPPPPPGYLPPPPWSLPPPTPVLDVELAEAYRKVDQEGMAAYAVARTMSDRVVNAHVIIAVATLALALSPLLVFRRVDPWGLLAPVAIAFYFGFSAWALRRKFAWIDQELRSGRIPSEADLGGGIFHFPRHRAPEAGPMAAPTLPADESVFSRTLVRLQFGRHMARDARQFAFVLLFSGFLLGSIAAWILTFGSLIVFAGGTAFIARDAAAAWGAAGLAALIVLALLYRIYSQIDRIDGHYRSLETTVGELERAFWSQFKGRGMGAEFPRPDLRVVGRILETLWRHAEPMRPTALQQASATNYTQFSRYLDFLAARGLVEVRTDDQGGRWVSLTARGREAHQFLVTGLLRLFADEQSAGRSQ